jgi:flagellar basal body P-ring protein FlgI
MKAFAPLSAILCTLASLAGGCAGPLLRPDAAAKIVSDAPQEPTTKLVGDFTHPYGMNYLQVEDVGLVVGLDGTGGDPPPSPQRATLMAEMKRREVEEPGKVLASPDTAMVLVRTILRPGAQKGDRVDAEVQVPMRGNTTSLRGGRLLPARLSELRAIDQQIHSGHVVAYAEGPVLVDPAAKEGDATSPDEAMLTRGRILGGAVVLKSRPLALVLDERHRSFTLSSKLGSAINRRFHSVIDGEKQGVANPQRDDFIELFVHPRYRENISRYLLVVRSIAIEETPTELQERLSQLQGQLDDPLTAQTAALRLEAVGSREAIEILKQALSSENVEARFYAAEALAYLDQTDAVAPLAAVIRDEPQFRVQALAAMSAMNDRKAYEALRELLDAQSAETRYGAFRALWAMDPHDPIVQGEKLGGQFTLHVVQTAGTPMVHVTGSLRPEIVLFGPGQRLQLPLTIDAGRHIVVNGASGHDVTISRFAPGMPTQKRVVEPDLEQVIRAVVELGGTYPDVVQMLQEARQAGGLAGWFRVDALPGVEQPTENLVRVSDDAKEESTSGIRRFATSWTSLFE